MNILLCGLPFSGKTTFGNLAANQLNVPFLDTDKIIETLYEKSSGVHLTCRQLYKELGEPNFRELEANAIAHLIESCPKNKCHVISLGGGTLLLENNRTLLHKIGSLVYLKTPIHTLIERLHKQPSQPAYLDELDPDIAFEQLAESREHIYEITADVIINTEYLNEQEIVKAICSSAGRRPQPKITSTT